MTCWTIQINFFKVRRMAQSVLEDRVEEAAKIAATGFEGIEYDGLYRHLDTERVDIHFRQGSHYFGVQILTGGHPEYPARTNVEVLTDQITRELLKRQA